MGANLPLAVILSTKKLYRVGLQILKTVLALTIRPKSTYSCLEMSYTV